MVRPDLLVRTADGSARLAIDAKYKVYDERRIDPGDLYQTFLYAYGLSAQPPGTLPTAVVLYPGSGGESRRVQLRVRRMGGGDGADVQFVGVPLPGVLQEMASREMGPVLRGLGGILEGLLSERRSLEGSGR